MDWKGLLKANLIRTIGNLINGGQSLSVLESNEKLASTSFSDT